MTTAKIRTLIRYTPYSLLWCFSGRWFGTVSGLLRGVRTRRLSTSSIFLGGAISIGFLGFTIRSRSVFLGSTFCRLLVVTLLLLAALFLLLALFLLFATLLFLLAALFLLFATLLLLLLLFTTLLFLLGLLGAGGEGNCLFSRLALFCLCLGHLCYSLCFGSISLRLLLLGYCLSSFFFLDCCLRL